MNIKVSEKEKENLTTFLTLTFFCIFFFLLEKYFSVAVTWVITNRFICENTGTKVDGNIGERTVDRDMEKIVKI